MTEPMMDETLLAISREIANINLESTLRYCSEALSKGISAERVLKALSEGMKTVGEKFETREYFLSELIMAGEIMKEAHLLLKPHFEAGQKRLHERVVIGTVRGDLHDIGKNIVVSILSGLGFDVTDLGVDVPAERFVEAVKEIKPRFLGLSALLRATAPEIGRVVESLKAAGLRDSVKVIVGGLPLNEEYAKRLGADFYAQDAWKGAEIIREEVLKG
ncbi:MAG: corrinoid protein [Candidatus Bathyarchaeia archaeon]